MSEQEERQKGILIAEMICELLNRHQRGDPDAAGAISDISAVIDSQLVGRTPEDFERVWNFKETYVRHIKVHREQRCITQQPERVN